MTNDTDEEAMIINEVMASRHNVELLKKEASALRTKIAQAEKTESECEQALIDYYASAGVTKSECGDFSISLGQSQSVDCPDIDSVPEKYIRTKVVKEVNKALIKAEQTPPSNWLQYNTKTTLTIKHKEA